MDSGELPPGYACDDGAALLFRGTEFTEVIASSTAARAYRVEPGRQAPIEPARIAKGF